MSRARATPTLPCHWWGCYKQPRRSFVPPPLRAFCKLEHPPIVQRSFVSYRSPWIAQSACGTWQRPLQKTNRLCTNLPNEAAICRNARHGVDWRAIKAPRYAQASDVKQASISLALGRNGDGTLRWTAAGRPCRLVTSRPNMRSWHHPPAAMSNRLSTAPLFGRNINAETSYILVSFGLGRSGNYSLWYFPQFNIGPSSAKRPCRRNRPMKIFNVTSILQTSSKLQG